MLKPTNFGLKDEEGSKIQIKELYINGQFLTLEDFNNKFKTKINSLNHRTLEKVMEENLSLKNNTRINTEETKMEPHWISSITKLFHKQTKGSKIFRKVLTYFSPIKVKLNLEKWRKKLGTEEVCKIEITNGFRSLQNKFSPKTAT